MTALRILIQAQSLLHLDFLVRMAVAVPVFTTIQVVAIATATAAAIIQFQRVIAIRQNTIMVTISITADTAHTDTTNTTTITIITGSRSGRS